MIEDIDNGVDDKERHPVIQFGFGNGELLQMLEGRASAIKSGKFEKSIQIQEKMTDFKNRNLKDLMRPRSAFIIFQDQQHFHMTLKEIKQINFVIPSAEQMRKKSTLDMLESDLTAESGHLLTF